MDPDLPKLPVRNYLYAGMMMHTCNPSTQKATAGVSKA